MLVSAAAELKYPTAAVMKLFPKPKGREVAWVGLQSPKDALALFTLASERAGASLTAFELIVDAPLAFVLNGASPRARITTEAAIALSHHGAVAPAVVHQRVDFASSMIDGRTVMELSEKSKSTGEIGELLHFLEKRLRGDTSSPLLENQSLRGAA